ncbi:MAG: class II fructose-bisphosphate aldolase, partial [Candidatus Bathyarchaeia archaeon]
VLQCIQKGVNSVMIDGSSLDLQGNIALTKEVVQIAHKIGIPVEAELGRTSAVGPRMTDPEDAKNFVEETGVDSLSISIGNVSGMMEGTARLDFDRLKMVRKSVSVPLVLHGGTGIPPSSLRKAIKMGVAKINVGHQVFREAIRAAKKTLCSPEAYESAFQSIHSYTKEELECIKRVAMQKIEEFGSAKRA